jgi:glycosyltransferase involved in cell wall biosynthesis
MLRITYAARSFLDYRVPVFAALDELTRGHLQVIYSTGPINPMRVRRKIKNILGDRAVGLGGEVRIGVIDDPNFANSAVGIVYQPGLLAAISQSRPDVIIGDGFGLWTSFALLHCVSKKTPLVVCYERTFHTERNSQWYRMLYRKSVLHWVGAMACNGSLSAAYAQWLGMPAERITLGHMVADTEGLQNAVDNISVEDRRTFRQRCGDSELVFLVVTQLVERKGVGHLLAAWAQGGRTWGRKVALVIVGDGPERERLLNQANAAGLKSVWFEGAVDYEQMAAYYAAADAFIIPTLEDNWSLVVPEAMACGLPILCSKYNGCWPELVQEGNGWVFDPLDPQDTLRTLNLCIQKGSELPGMGQESRAIIAGQTPQHAAKSIYEACRIAVEQKVRVRV